MQRMRHLRGILGTLAAAALMLAGCTGMPAPERVERARPDWRAALTAPEPELGRRALPNRVHHLNCASNAPLSSWLVNGTGGLFERGHTICHVLLVETNQGLVLVDAGLGTRDIHEAEKRFMWSWFVLVGPRFDVAETALHQVRALGFRPEDVKHVVITHLDLDHAGGLADFPQARVHLLAAELARTNPASPYYEPISAQRWEHGPNWQPHTPDADWFGFASAAIAPGLEPDVRLVSLPGHTVGHAGVAVQDGSRWLLHAGDAYFHHGEVRSARRWCPPALDWFQTARALDTVTWSDTQARLRALAHTQADRVSVFSAHDPIELAALTAHQARLGPVTRVAGPARSLAARSGP